MTTWRTGGSVDIHVAVPPEAVYDIVSDVTKTGERDPECREADWLPGATPGTVGARFRGRNRAGRFIRWSRVCEVVTAEPAQAFAFRTVPERIDVTRNDSTTWSYALVPEDGGTRITHSYEITKMPMAPMQALYGRLLPQHRDMRPQMAETLAKLKVLLEG
jgi:hypothetical protein